MDNKMKKSKYAALVLASTMALSTVVTAAPQAFDNNAITAQAVSVDKQTANDKGTVTIVTSAGTKKYDVSIAADKKITFTEQTSSDKKDVVVAESGDTVILGDVSYAVNFNEAKDAGYYDTAGEVISTFPTNPTVGDKITVGSTTYTYAAAVEDPKKDAGFYSATDVPLTQYPTESSAGDKITVGSTTYTYATAKAASVTIVEDEPTAANLTTYIKTLKVSDENYEKNVALTRDKVKKLSAAEQTKFKSEAILKGHEAIVKQSGLLASIKALPKESKFKKKDGSYRLNAYTISNDAIDTKSITDKKGNKSTVGANSELEEAFTKLATFKKAYDTVSVNKEAKTALKDVNTLYTKLMKLATASDLLVQGSYDAIKFDEAYTAVTVGGDYTPKAPTKNAKNVFSNELKVSKKGVFTVDGDKYTATIDDKKKITVTSPKGKSVDSPFEVKNFDPNYESALTALYEKLDISDGEMILDDLTTGTKKELAGKKIEVTAVTKSVKAVTAHEAGFYKTSEAKSDAYEPKAGDTLTGGATYYDAIEADADKKISAREAGFFATADAEAKDKVTPKAGDVLTEMYDGEKEAEYVYVDKVDANAAKEGAAFAATLQVGEEEVKVTDGDTLEINGIVFVVSENVDSDDGTFTIAVVGDESKPTLPTFDESFTVEYKDNNFIVKQNVIKTSIDEGGIKLHNLSKSMTVKEYKKLIPGINKYEANEIRVIKALETEYKALSANGKKSVTKDDVTTYKKYVADVKVQETLDKKIIAAETKDVTEKIKKIKYTTYSEYAKSIEEANDALNALPEKYQKKIKEASLKALDSHNKVLDIVGEIDALPADQLAKATTAAEIKGIQAQVDAIAKTVKGNKDGGTGKYYSNLTKTQRSYVKNFKKIANFNKEITKKSAYIAQKTNVDKFETALTKVSGLTTLRLASDTAFFDNLGYGGQLGVAFTISKDKAKNVTLTPFNTDDKVSFKVATNTTTKINSEALNAKVEVSTVDADKKVKVLGKEITFTKDSDTNTGVTKIGDNAVTDGFVTVDGKKYSVVFAAPNKVTVTEQVVVTDKDADIVVANGDTVTLDGNEYVVSIANEKITVGTKEVNGTPTALTTDGQGKKYKATLSTDKLTATITDATSVLEGVIVTNNKGTVTLAKKSAEGLSVYSFKGMSEAGFKSAKTNKYTKEQIASIAAATKAYNDLSKEAKKQVNKEDTTLLKAYQAAVKAQTALAQKALAADFKAVSYSTNAEVDAKDVVTGSTYEKKYEDAQASYDNVLATYPELKAKVQKSYEEKLKDHKAASAVVTEFVKLPEKPTKAQVTAVQGKYDKLTAAQKKLVKGLETAIKSAMPSEPTK